MNGTIDVAEGISASARAAAPMRAALVVNARSGTIAVLDGGAQALIREARAHFALAQDPAPDLPIDIQISRALACNPEVILVAGGDGTVSAVADRLGEGTTALGVIPGGTMNRLAARLGLPADPRAAVRALARAEPVTLPAARLNGHLFLYQVLIGPPTRLVRFREMQRGHRFGWLPLARAALRALLRPLQRSVRVVLPTGERRRAVAAVVTVPEPGAAKAILRIETIEGSGFLAGLRQAALWIRGRLADAPDVFAVEAAAVAVAGRQRRIRASLDGEMILLRRPLRIRLMRRGISALRPRFPDA
jgi:diacylglycerol kinase family enzyme